MGMEIDEEESPVTGYVYGMGGMGRDFAGLSTPNNNYQFGLSSPTPPPSPVAEHIECAMDVDSPTPCPNQEAASLNDDATIQAYVFGQNGMGSDFVTLPDQMAEQDRYYNINMATDGAMDSPPPRQVQGASANPPGAATQSSAASQTQLSSSMPPPPPPATAQAPVTGTLIQPYGLPANAPPAHQNVPALVGRTLANSGVSVATDYPLSTSPRRATRDINRHLDGFGDAWWHSNPHPMLSGDALGHRYRAPVVIPNSNFQAFSYDSTSQPRTAAARAQGDDDNVSPRIKSNKR